MFLRAARTWSGELTREPFAGPAAGSMGLHLAIFGMLICYGWAMGLFHHNYRGALTSGSGGSIQVTLTNTIPLPADQVNQTVLATETRQSKEAPAAPSPKEQKHIDETAIPILGKPTKPTAKNIPKPQLAPAAAETECGAVR